MRVGKNQNFQNCKALDKTSVQHVVLAFVTALIIEFHFKNARQEVREKKKSLQRLRPVVNMIWQRCVNYMKLNLDLLLIVKELNCCFSLLNSSLTVLRIIASRKRFTKDSWL